MPNRRLLLDRLQLALAAAARSRWRGTLLLIDLDNFKVLNDTHGHDHGDLLLRQVAQRLNSCIREADTAARLGGDEFVVMLTDLSDNADEARRQAEAVGEKSSSRSTLRTICAARSTAALPVSASRFLPISVPASTNC